MPCRLVPLLAGWADLDERESAADIEPGHPVLIDPEFRIDPVLAGLLARSRFTWLAEGTRASVREVMPTSALVSVRPDRRVRTARRLKIAEELRSRRNDQAVAIDQPERLLPLARGNEATPLRHDQVHEVTGDLSLLEHGNRT